MHRRLMLTLALLALLGIALLAHQAHSPSSLAQSSAPDALVLTARTGGHLGAVIADGNMAYASYDFRIHAYDFSDPAAPKRVASRPEQNGRPRLLPGNLARMARRGEWTYGLVDWDRPPPIDRDSHVQFVVLDKWLNVAGTLDLPGFTLTHGWQQSAQELALLGDRHVLVADAGEQGHRLRVIDVSQPARPILVGSFAPEGLPVGLAWAGDFAYLLEEDRQKDLWQVAVLDLSNPAEPKLAERFPTVDGAMDLAVGDGHLFALGCGGLEAYSLADPAKPRLVGSRRALDLPQPTATPGAGPTPTPAPSVDSILCWSESNLAWRDGLLYAVTVEQEDPFNPFIFDTALWVFDVREPERPSLHSLTRVDGDTERLAVGDGFAVAASDIDGLRAIDLSRPGQPRAGAALAGGAMAILALAASPDFVVQSAVVGFSSELQFIVPGEGIVRRLDLGREAVVRDLAIHGDLILAAADFDRLLVIDARDPVTTPPRIIAVVPAEAALAAVAAAGNYAYLAEADHTDGSPKGSLRVLDLRDPGRPVEVARSPGSFLSLAVRDGLVYAGPLDAPLIRVFQTTIAPGGVTLVPTGDVALDEPAHELVADGSRLYALDDGNKLHVVDASDPAQPRRLGQLALYDAGGDNAVQYFSGVGLAARGDVVYVGSDGGMQGALQTIDVSDPTAPRRVAVREIPSHSLIVHGPVTLIPSGGQVAVAGWGVHVAGDVTGLWSFGAGTLPERTEQFEGLFWANFEHSQFSPASAGCAPDPAWWFLFLEQGGDFERRYRAIYPNYRDSGPSGRSGWVWARFEGRVTPPSHTGFQWYRERAVTVSRVLDMWAVPGCAYAPRPGRAIYLPYGLMDHPQSGLDDHPPPAYR